MSFRQSVAYRLTLWVLTVACLGAAGYVGYLTFWAGDSPQRVAENAARLYERGLEAYARQEWEAAAQQFDAARVLAEKGLNLLDKQGREGRIRQQEYKQALGQLNWIKARAIRDYHFATAAAEGKPLSEVPDPVHNETFRPVQLIPDADDRQEAVVALRTAGNILKSDPDVLREALRLEITLTPINWKFTEPLLREGLKQNPDNPRVRYFLARYEFDQPQEDGFTPTEERRRSTERVEQAKEHLAVAKKNSPQFWRVAGLEAEILHWTIRTADSRRVKPEVRAAAEKQLDELLFTPDTGLVALLSRGEKLANFGQADSVGIARTLRIALDRALATARRRGGSLEPLWQTAQAALECARKMQAESSLRPHLPATQTALAEVAAVAQPYLAQADAAAWRDYLAAVEQLLQQTPDGTAPSPLARLQLAQLTLNDAIVAARSGDTTRHQQLLAKAVGLAEEGLKATAQAQLSAAQVDEFHQLLVELKLKQGARRDALEPHLARLRASPATAIRQRGQFLEAVLAEREGKLERARKLLEPLAAHKQDANLALRAKMLLANLAMAMNEPTAALAYLREIEPVFQNLEVLPPLERAWVEELTGGRDLVVARIVQAHLAITLQVLQKYQRDNPGKPVPAELIQGNLQGAREQLAKLRPPSPADRAARLVYANLLLLLGQRKDAENAINSLATDYPDSIDVLRARCLLLAAPQKPDSREPDPDGVAAADTLIRKFMKDYPADKAARLFYAEWLVQTRRAERAVEYLRDPAQFAPDDPAAQRLLGFALLRLGQREAAQKVLAGLPRDPNLDLILIQTAITREQGEKHLQDALKRYENQGRFRVYEAMLRLQEGKFEEAVRGFASAIEFTEVRNAARSGLVLALISYVMSQPEKGRQLALQMVQEMPDEANLYLVAADAALLAEEVGDPSDRWEAVKTMYAALNKWEEIVSKQGTPRAEIGYTKAKAHYYAGYPERARREALNALAQKEDHGPTLLLLAELHLEPPAELERTREFLERARKAIPTDARLPYLEARVHQATGQWAQAAAIYQKLVQENPNDPTPRPLLIAALETAGQRDAALQQAREWLAQMPDNAAAARETIRLLALTGNKAEAVQLADRFVSQQMAAAKKRLGEQQPPLPPAEQERQLDAARNELLLLVATAFHKGNAPEEALVRLREVTGRDPNHLGALLLLGEIALAAQRWDEAIAAYNAVLKSQPRHFVAGNNLAWILAEKLQQPDRALLIVQEIWKGRGGVKPVAPERLPAEFLDTIGVIYKKLNRTDLFAEMRTIFEAAVRRYPADPRMYLYLADAQAGLGERSKALENYDMAFRLASGKTALPPDQVKMVLDGVAEGRKRLQN